MTLGKELSTHSNYYLLDKLILVNVITTPWEDELLRGLFARIKVIISLSKGIRGLKRDLFLDWRNWFTSSFWALISEGESAEGGVRWHSLLPGFGANCNSSIPVFDVGRLFGSCRVFGSWGSMSGSMGCVSVSGGRVPGCRYPSGWEGWLNHAPRVSTKVSQLILGTQKLVSQASWRMARRPKNADTDDMKQIRHVMRIAKFWPRFLMMRISTPPLRTRTLNLTSISRYVVHINTLRRPFQPARANGAQSPNLDLRDKSLKSRRVSSPTYPLEKAERALICGLNFFQFRYQTCNTNDGQVIVFR